MSATASGKAGPVGDRERRLWHAIWGGPTALWLLVLAIILGLGAYILYPKDTQIPPDDAVQGVSVLANFTPSTITMTQAPEPAIDGMQLLIAVHDAKPVPHAAAVEVALPPKAWGSKTACPKPAIVCRSDSAGLKDATYVLPQKWSDGKATQAAADRYSLQLQFTVADVGSNLSRNAEYISVLTPPIAFRLAPRYPYRPVATVYAEEVPDGNAYTWSTGADPVYVSGSDRWSATSADAVQEAASATLNSGTNLGVQAEDGNLQFIAGIVVGVAGGALVGSVQEWLDHRRRLQPAPRPPLGTGAA